VRYRLAWPGQLVRNAGMQSTIEQWLSASEFLERIAGKSHRRANIGTATFGVLMPNSLWRALVATQASQSLGRVARRRDQRQYGYLPFAVMPDTRRDICGLSWLRAPTRCLR